MSTRCQIEIIGSERSVLLYHHWDGYPEGVGFDLMQRAKKFKNYTASTIANELVKNNKEDDGYEISFCIHTDIEYWYEIDCRKHTIRCWKVKGFLLNDHAEVEKGEEIKFIPVAGLIEKAVSK